MVMLLMVTDLVSGCVQPIMGPLALVHRHRGHKVFFHVGIQDRQLVVIPGIHYFDAHSVATGPLGHIGSPD